MEKLVAASATVAGGLPYDGFAQLVARLARAPMALVLLARGDGVQVGGRFGVLSDDWLPAADPLCEQVVLAARVVHSNNLTIDDAPWWPASALLRQWSVRALLGVPLRDRDGRMTGALLVLDRRAHHWATEDVTSLLAVADLLRLGRDGPTPVGSLDGTTMLRVGRFRACHHTVEQSLRSSETAAEAAPRLLEAVAVALGWPAAELFLVDEQTGNLDAAGHWSTWAVEPADFFGHTPIKGSGVTGRVWHTGQPAWVDDITLYAELVTPFERDRVRICAEHGIRTVMAVPVCDGDHLLGVLTCYAGTAELHRELLTVLLDGVAAQIGIWIALRRAERLGHELGRAQDDFITLVGHELRTPLASITAHAGMLHDEADDLTPDQREIVAAINRNAMSLQSTVDLLLDLAGLESGHLPVRTERVDLCRLIADATGAARADIAKSGLRLHTRLPETLWLTGDPARLRQVIDDILANAVLYSPIGGEIQISATVDDTSAQVQFTDTGIGTPTDERARVFDRFYRGSNVRHHGTAGSGLGLSRARAIITLHHGHIWLTGNSPTGTTVTIRLPASPAL
ncbi:ATP-binding protein [Actinoplanes sp. NPDC026619]|uniref:sensor histidine kinase n=1 Tax=Actinoplanes sp. NPDC026619 TaxID=3155798 RepID=UPI0033FE1D68